MHIRSLILLALVFAKVMLAGCKILLVVTHSVEIIMP